MQIRLQIRLQNHLKKGKSANRTANKKRSTLTAHGGNRNRTYSLGDKYKEWTGRQFERQINHME